MGLWQRFTMIFKSKANKALDLIGGKTITIGSVSGGERFVAGGRLLIVGTDRVDGAALDASQRWTWTGNAERLLAIADALRRGAP